MEAIDGRRITVMGLGRFGGGVGVTRWLCGQGAEVLVTDLDPGEGLGDSLGSLEDLVRAGRVRVRLGGHEAEDFTGADLVVANPAVPRPWENRYLRLARESGVAITTEIGLLTERLPRRERVVGVTGTNGKSTTASMVGHVLSAVGSRVVVGGNVGGTLLGRLGEIDEATWVVLELSSAMLHWLEGWSPGIAVVTNVTPNHLDWHGSAAHYEASKRRIVEHQRPGDSALLGAGAEGWRLGTGVERLGADDRAEPPGLVVPGVHNVANARMAVGVARACGVGAERAWEAVAGYPGLPHRLEYVGEACGVRYYNDSKATTPEASDLAIESVSGGRRGRVHLVAGGYDKGSALEAWARGLRDLAGVYAIGATGARIASESGGVEAGTLGRAVALAVERARAGDVVLLSPGCASWDQFVNFEARGEAFKRAVRDAGVLAGNNRG